MDYSDPSVRKKLIIVGSIGAIALAFAIWQISTLGSAPAPSKAEVQAQQHLQEIATQGAALQKIEPPVEIPADAPPPSRSPTKAPG
jgi:amino acid permease